jgi:hypothetical protein
VSDPKSLSPAAQAVLDAFWRQPGITSAIAAALRAVADQVVPEEEAMPLNLAMHLGWDERQLIRAKTFAIAAELKGQP